jgi:hypothetical protein
MERRAYVTLAADGTVQAIVESYTSAEEWTKHDAKTPIADVIDVTATAPTRGDLDTLQKTKKFHRGSGKFIDK